MATPTPQQLVAAVRGKDPMDGLCQTKQISSEGCDWLKFALDPFHDLQLDNLRGFPDVNTEPTVIVKVRQAIEVSAPPGLGADQNWDCHIVLSPVDWAKPPGGISFGATVPAGETPTGLGYNAMCQFLPQGKPLSVPSGSRSVNGGPAGAIMKYGHASPTGSWTTGRLDGLVINSVPADHTGGADMTFTPGHMPNTAHSGYQVQNITLDKYLDYDDTDLGAYRIVYSGFEAVNTTAQIKKQGAVTVYEYGHSYEPSQAFTLWDDTDPTGEVTKNGFTQSVATNTFRCPPNTISEAKIMPGSHTWAAQDGCYCTAKFITDNPFQTATQRNYAFAQNTSESLPSSGFGILDGLPQCGSIISPGLVSTASGMSVPTTFTGGELLGPNWVAPATHFSRMSTCGAYFTGLSAETTLFITWRVGIERLPAANKPTFLALAQPSAVFDPNALTLYNLIANNLPPGCPQGWNDAGRWFRNIAAVATKVIPEAFPIVTAAQMILRGMGAERLAAAVPAIAAGAKQVAKQAKQTAAAKKLQRAARKKKAVNNFGHPGGGGGARVQRFSQMS